MIKIVPVSRENCIRAADVIMLNLLRVPTLRLPRTIRWRLYSEIHAIHPGQVEGIHADGEEHLGILTRWTPT